MRPFKHGAVMIGRNLDLIVQFEAAGHDAGDGLIRRHPQFRGRTSRLPKYSRLFARLGVPTDDGEQTSGFEDFMNGTGKPRLVRNAVECIGEENMINRLPHDLWDVVGVSLDKRAVGGAASFGKSYLRSLQQRRVDVDADDIVDHPGEREREPAIPAT